MRVEYMIPYDILCVYIYIYIYAEPRQWGVAHSYQKLRACIDVISATHVTSCRCTQNACWLFSAFALTQRGVYWSLLTFRISLAMAALRFVFLTALMASYSGRSSGQVCQANGQRSDCGSVLHGISPARTQVAGNLTLILQGTSGSTKISAPRKDVAGVQKT